MTCSFSLPNFFTLGFELNLKKCDVSAYHSFGVFFKYQGNDVPLECLIICSIIFITYHCVRVLTYLWYAYLLILLANFNKSNGWSNPWFFFIVLWAYCSLQYYWIICSNNPTPLVQYFTRQIIHPHSNTWISQWLWILIIE